MAAQFLKLPMHTQCLTQHFMTDCLVEFPMELIQAVDLIYPNVREKICQFLVEVAKAGYGKSRQQVKSLAANAIHDKGLLDTGSKLSNGWYYRFINRNQQLVLRKGDPTANVRMDSVNKETMENYFSMLKDTLEQYDLLNSPNQIYNVDETGMPLDHRPPKIVTARGQKKVRCRTSGNKSQITIIACVSAVGQVIPPFCYF